VRERSKRKGREKNVKGEGRAKGVKRRGKDEL